MTSEEADLTRGRIAGTGFDNPVADRARTAGFGGAAGDRRGAGSFLKSRAATVGFAGAVPARGRGLNCGGFFLCAEDWIGILLGVTTGGLGAFWGAASDTDVVLTVARRLSPTVPLGLGLPG